MIDNTIVTDASSTAPLPSSVKQREPSTAQNQSVDATPNAAVMNGNRAMPNGPPVGPHQERRRNQHHQYTPNNQHQQYPYQPYNGYMQPYPNGYQNAVYNNHGYYQVDHPYVPQYANTLQTPGHYGYPPPHYGRTPPPVRIPPPLPQQQQYNPLNPNAQFTPHAATHPVQTTPAIVSSQPSPVAPPTAYQQPQSPSYPPPPRSASQSPVRSSTPGIAQITEPLYAEPESPVPPPQEMETQVPKSESPEPEQRDEIYVPPVPWFNPPARVPWPAKYTGQKQQNPPREGYFVKVASREKISRRGGARSTLDLFADQFPDSLLTPKLPIPHKTPTPSTEKITESPKSTPIVPAIPVQSGSNTANDVGDVKDNAIKELDSASQGPIAQTEKPNAAQESEKTASEEPPPASKGENVEHSREPSDLSKTLSIHSSEQGSTSEPAREIQIPQKAKPTLWANLFKGPASSGSAPPKIDPASKADTPQVTSSTAGKSKNESLADALNACVIGGIESKISFLEPRGLVNIGNICYMSSVLQVLVFCVPFYDFLDQVGKRSAHSFKSDTPLVDAMIMFMREFKVIDSAVSVDKLKMRLKGHELEQYGEPFTPEYLYNAVKKSPHFKNMETGKQQDAEEFLSYLLQGLHEECATIMTRSTSATATPTNQPVSPTSESGSLKDDSEWQQVGHKQKIAVSRSSGNIEIMTPIKKIFAGELQSEVRVLGKPNSITTQDLQALQLDIGSAGVNDIVDALKDHFKAEVLDGDFKSPRGSTKATKQVSINKLPQVLILHLKRFVYDDKVGTRKIWKQIGYPLELEIPKEALPRKQLNTLGNRTLPKYRLTAVVYHHGTDAARGHYTVDVRRQDGHEWIKLDDTIIKRIRSEDVAAEGKNEESSKGLGGGAKSHKNASSANTNPFAGMSANEEEDDDDSESKEWQQVNGSSNTNGSSKTFSSVANGATTPKRKSDNVKDKVAYLLFYQRI